MPPTQQAEPTPKTAQFRKFGTVNLTDARVAIADEELAWLENAMTIGNGAIQIVPGPGAPIAAPAGGVRSHWGFVLNGAAIDITAGLDGSLHQIAVPAGTIVSIAPAATVTAPHLAIWRDTHVLIVDPVTGYMKWDGTAFAVIDAARTGAAVSVFEGRVWIAKRRTISFSAPGTFDNFLTADGGGSVIVTDEAFPGEIIALVSVGEQLWILGPNAIDTIGNVTSSGVSPNVVTLFSITNIVTGIGTSSPLSALGYFRALAFAAPFGIYGLAGVTPQKLSDKLDGLFELLDVAFETSAALAVIQSLPVFCLLVRYLDPLGARPLLLCFTQGKWFFGSQGALTSITTVLVNGVSQVWGTDGTSIFRVFGASAATPVPYLVITKLYDFGGSVNMKAVTKAGFEFQASLPIAPEFLIDSESRSTPVPFRVSNQILFIINDAGVPLQLVNDVGDPLTIITEGMVLSRNVAVSFGRYLGMTIRGTDPPYRIQALQLEVKETRQWDAP